VNISVRRRSSKSLAIAALVIAAFMALPTLVWAAEPEPVDLEVMTQIRQEGFRNSQAMQILGELTDRIGPRVTGSPNMKTSNEWTRDKMASWGLSNAHLEGYEFGRGWAEDFTSVRMITPEKTMLFAIPRAWSPSTTGTVRGKVVRLAGKTKEELERQYHGKLAGAIVLVGDYRELKPHTEAESVRYTDQRLTEIAQYTVPAARMGMGGPDRTQEMRQAYQRQREMAKFLADEKVGAVIEPSRFDGGAITMQGGEYKKGSSPGVPTINMSAEHYGRIYRLLERGVPVELEINVQTKFFDDDSKAYNTIADLPGTDPKLAEEVVIIGGHLDSWHGGTGATDNATGVAAAMEAIRILKALDLKPRRTIRVGLWSGEEQGLLGAKAYVDQHYASRPEPSDPKEREIPSWMRTSQPGPLEFKPDYKKISAYFNLDNGTGKLRGIYAQENAAVVPIFQSWIEPFKDLGCTTVTMRNTGGTDHQPFDAVGIPGFQFIQDPVEYFSRTHHTNIDTYERVQPDDLMQQAVILAAFAYNAAMRDEPLPRKPLPKEKPNAAAMAAPVSTSGK